MVYKLLALCHVFFSITIVDAAALYHLKEDFKLMLLTDQPNFVEGLKQLSIINLSLVSSSLMA